MTSIEGAFTIKVDGQTVSNAEDNGEGKIQASFGSEPATFTLIDGRLESNGCYLSRALVEDRSLLPKRVYWFRKEEGNASAIHVVTAKPNGTTCSLLFSGAPLMSSNNLLFADLMQDQGASVEITMV
ncbi:hypothetical protein N7478_007246 [Penicillium angulare]|uniref:uncharacterized protein n=1 Tax=Penicillium angulare TaxID=116970 RepID=UPI00253FB945|nr:uncharacterized protein N7478_007246 [Penicillium angulare]KAJ5281874.1 hypothetical protein N7478_007246 [Penicillium angulare]